VCVCVCVFAPAVCYLLPHVCAISLLQMPSHSHLVLCCVVRVKGMGVYIRGVYVDSACVCVLCVGVCMHVWQYVCVVRIQLYVVRVHCIHVWSIFLIEEKQEGSILSRPVLG
jgi:hypothetical protein